MGEFNYTKNSTLRKFCLAIAFHKRKQCAASCTLIAPVVHGAIRRSRVMHSSLRKCRIAFSEERWLHKGRESLEGKVVSL